MPEQIRPGMSRRKAVVGGVAAAAAAAVARVHGASAVHSVGSGGGIIGGGLAKMADGEANVALAALIFREESGLENVDLTSVLGRFVWVGRDAEGQSLVLESAELSGYKYVHDLDQGEGREIYGYLTVNGSGSHPFTIKVIDDGMPGAGRDSITVAVEGDISELAAARSDFAYSATATLETGGFEVVHFGDEATYSHEH